MLIRQMLIKAAKEYYKSNNWPTNQDHNGMIEEYLKRNSLFDVVIPMLDNEIKYRYTPTDFTQDKGYKYIKTP